MTTIIANPAFSSGATAGFGSGKSEVLVHALFRTVR
jgi:hypothetical protein